MAQRSPNYTLVLVLLIISTGITFWAQTRPGIALLPADVASMPANVGKWHKFGEDQQPDTDVLEGWLVSKENFLSRTYQNGDGEKVTLMLVYKGLDRRGWHVSEMCFSGSGYNVRQSVTNIPYAGRDQLGVQLIAKSTETGATVMSVYWFALGSRAEHNFWKQQAYMALARLNPPKEGWAFIRVTTEVSGSEQEALQRIRDFVQAASGPLVSALTSVKPGK